MTAPFPFVIRQSVLSCLTVIRQSALGFPASLLLIPDKAQRQPEHGAKNYNHRLTKACKGAQKKGHSHDDIANP